MRPQQLYIESHEEKLTAREHGFDRDFWAGSPSDRTTKLYRVHVKPRSSMFDPRLCATSPIPVGGKSCHARLTCEKHASARSDDSDSGLEDDGIQTNSDATVRPVTLPEVWTVVLNSLRQVVYCHVKSGIACFQMPENPELLNDLKFENGSSSGSGDLSQKRR